MPSENRHAARWTRTLHQWHWISSAICLAGLLLFAVTGITLNHAGDIPAQPKVTHLEARLPAGLKEWTAPHARSAPLPAELRNWLAGATGIDPGAAAAEWSDDEIYVALPRPGGDAWLRIDRSSGEVEAEITERGWVAWLNDLHKGRHTGLAWRLFIDIFSAACLVFAVTGLLLLHRHGARRPATWPTVALGLAIPGLIAYLIGH